jgi:hypothetical protein
MSERLLAAIFVALLGVFGCSQSANEEAFRIKHASGQTGSSTPTPNVPPLASHISSQGEVTPQVAPPNLEPPAEPEDQVTSRPSSTEGEHGVSQFALGEQPRTTVMAPPTGLGESGPSVQVDLSAAVALAMTGPEGTMMGFSVDYRVKGTSLSGQSPFVWVIEGQGGKIYRMPVKLESQGNLMLVVPEWRPEDGPFRCRIEDQRQRAVSPTVDMR